MTYLKIVVTTGALALLLGCSRDEQSDVETSGERAAEHAGEALEHAGDAAETAARSAAEEVGQAMEKAGESLQREGSEGGEESPRPSEQR